MEKKNIGRHDIEAKFSAQMDEKFKERPGVKCNEAKNVFRARPNPAKLLTRKSIVPKQSSASKTIENLFSK